MDSLMIQYGVMAVAAALSGFFLLGFVFYTIYAVIYWLRQKTNKEKLWGGLLGLGLNGLVFVLTFPKVLPVAIEAVNKVLLRFL